LEKHKQEFATPEEALAAMGLSLTTVNMLEEVIAAFRPSILIGTTGQPGDFNPAALRAMAKHCARPMIFALSNPTSKAECTPYEALMCTEGRALVATGSPFDPVDFNGRRHVIGQCNNVFIFPGIGLGALVSQARRVTDSMFLAAARTLAQLTRARATQGCLYPGLGELREASRQIGFTVARTARDEGLGRDITDEQLKAEIEASIWFPDYATAG
jgi:malic enzyme